MLFSPPSEKSNAGDLPCVVVERGLKFLSHLYGGEGRFWAQVNSILVDTDPYTDHRHGSPLTIPTVSNYTLIPKRKPPPPRPISGGIGSSGAAAHMGLRSADKKATGLNQYIIRKHGKLGGISGAQWAAKHPNMMKKIYRPVFQDGSRTHETSDTRRREQLGSFS